MGQDRRGARRCAPGGRSGRLRRLPAPPRERAFRRLLEGVREARAKRHLRPGLACQRVARPDRAEGQPCAQNRGVCEQAVKDAAAELRKQGPGGSEKAVVLDARLARAVERHQGRCGEASQEVSSVPKARSIVGELAVRLARETGSSDLVVTCSRATGCRSPCAGREELLGVAEHGGAVARGRRRLGLALRSFTDAAEARPRAHVGWTWRARARDQELHDREGRARASSVDGHGERRGAAAHQ